MPNVDLEKRHLNRILTKNRKFTGKTRRNILLLFPIYYLPSCQVLQLHTLHSLQISKEHVGLILHKHFSMRKLFSKFVPRLLIMFQNNIVTMILRVVWTMDDTCINHYTPEANLQSAEWPAATKDYCFIH